MAREFRVTLQGVEFRVTSEHGRLVVVCPDGEVVGPEGVIETPEGLLTGKEIIDEARSKFAPRA